MINSNKLIPRRSSGNSLNLTATSDLNVVRGTVVKIDNILKGNHKSTRREYNKI